MVTRGREFSNNKRAGRNASEPISSLVNEFGEADPVVRRGRPLDGCWNNGSGVRRLPGLQGRHVLEDLLPSAGDPFLGVGRPPTAVYKETKAQWPETGVGGVHSTA